MPRAIAAGSRLVRSPRVVAAVAAGLVVGALLDQGLISGASFTTHAIVAMSDELYGGLPVSAREVSEQASVAAVLSKGVLVRAAGTLRSKGFAGPAPQLLDRLAIATGLADTSPGNGRLEQMLMARVVASQGTAPGTVAIAASDDRAETASLLATTVAEAFVADQGQAAADLRRNREAADAAKLRSLADTLDMARRRLAAFGPAGLDPVQARAEAGQANAAARARLDAFRTVIASGSPPLGAPAGLPSTIGPLQSEYLDLKRQLLEAQRTLGEKHTTVIGLQDGVLQAGKALSAEWKRLAQGAEADWKLASERDALLAKGDTSRDAKTRQSIAEARDAVRGAEAALNRFQATSPTTAILTPEQPYRLIATAAVPVTATGLPLALRLVLDSLAGLASALLVLRLRRRRPIMAAREDADSPAGRDGVHEPVVARKPAERTVPGPSFDKPRANRPMPKPRSSQPERSSMPSLPRRTAPHPVATDAPREAVRMLALRDAAADVAQLRSAQASFATVLVGGTEPAGAAMPVLLALARAAAEAGRRVLLIEGARQKPLLASAASLAARPVLVDILGMLRIALRDEQAAGTLFLAPAFPDLRRLAAGLAKRSDVPFLDEAAQAFDLVIMDNGAPVLGAGDDWSGLADAFVRIGDAASPYEDESFLTATGGTAARFIGTIATVPTRRAPPAAVDRQILENARASDVRDVGKPRSDEQRLSEQRFDDHGFDDHGFDEHQDLDEAIFPARTSSKRLSNARVRPSTVAHADPLARVRDRRRVGAR